MESWLRMTADAVHGADQAQRAIKALSENPMSPAALSGWLSAWMPEASGIGRRPTEVVGEFKEMLEQWWSMIGAVPLQQYQDLRARHDELTRRLRKQRPPSPSCVPPSQPEGTRRRRKASSTRGSA